MRYVLAFAALLCACLPAFAQSSDPYAASVAQAARARLQARYEEFFEGVRIYSFALACNAIPLKATALGAIAYNRFYFVNKLEPFEVMQRKIDNILAQGSRVATEKGCDLWNNTPRWFWKFAKPL